jgi:hypothetical protein
MIKQLTFLTLILLSYNILNSQTSLQGKITTLEGEILIGANLLVKNNGVFIAGISTDFNGNYALKLDPGTYDVTVSFLGFSDHQIESVVVKPDQVNKLDITLVAKLPIFGCCCSPFYSIPLIELDNPSSGATIISNDIKNTPFREVNDLILNTAGVSPANY